MEKTNRFERQMDIIDDEIVDQPISIIGAGGIGSWTTLLLAKMGFNNITVYDFDNVENHNVASQFYKESQLDMPKCEALKINVKEQTGIEIFTRGKDEEEIEKGIVIFALDSMERRIELGEFFKDKDVYIIDGRMGGLQMEVYCMPANSYQTTLVDPLSVSQDKCTARAISFNCAVIGGFIANYVRLVLKKQITSDKITIGFNAISLLREK